VGDCSTSLAKFASVKVRMVGDAIRQLGWK
jgi:hypothetical protein